MEAWTKTENRGPYPGGLILTYFDSYPAELSARLQVP